MNQELILKNINGFEFEELVADIFRKKGFKNVVVTPRTNDGGKDIIMDEVSPSGEIIKAVVECKHHKTGIGRPVVQKLHSAVSTLEYSGKKKGYIVSSSTFTDTAVDYVEKVNKQSNNLVLELIDGKKLKEIACDLGVNLKNGVIEAISNKSVSYSSESFIKTNTLESNFNNVNNINKDQVSVEGLKTTFHPIYYINYNIDSQCATSVGVIHEESGNEQLIIDGRTGNELKNELENFLLNGINNEKEITNGSCLQDKLDFQKNENELKNQAISEIINSRTKNVTYKGKNNVTYNKKCTPRPKDITIHDCRSLYYPEWTLNIKAKQKNYIVSFLESAGDFITLRNDTKVCQICNHKIEKNRWYCTYCGSIICKKHLKVTRLKKARICTNCSITKSFFGAKKYFESNEELETFNNYYASLPLYKKMWENTYLVFAIVFIIIIGLYFLFLN
ncbi:restriction endonuclease [Methanosarcina barkeri]|uniref:Type I restriction-modification system R subunit HsdR5 n=1 Tax=Methanosarcina barkeri CM1 TaxID=796385 RepID=A0A0G3CHX2_METBA|nr:restriction endonuclease [Methanosarcina barkeri]AKJ38677.1 type I restriction-modification system R subunit HsdR5 [Methanosarcina barkeri CM1]